MPDSTEPVIRGGLDEDRPAMNRDEITAASLAGLLFSGEKLAIVVTLDADGKTHVRGDATRLPDNRYELISRVIQRHLKGGLAECRGLGLLDAAPVAPREFLAGGYDTLRIQCCGYAGCDREKNGLPCHINGKTFTEDNADA